MSVKKFILGMLDAAVKIAFIVVVVMLIMKYSKLAYSYGYHLFNQTPVSSGTGRTVTVTVGKGDSASDIAENLFGVGLITDKTLFLLQERFSEYHGMEQAGSYELNTAMTPEEMLLIMSGGEKAGSGRDDEVTEAAPGMGDLPEPTEEESSEEGTGEGMEEGAGEEGGA